MFVKCSQTVVMNINIIRNTFVNIMINSHTLHFHQSDWFQIVQIVYIHRTIRYFISYFTQLQTVNKLKYLMSNQNQNKHFKHINLQDTASGEMPLNVLYHRRGCKDSFRDILRVNVLKTLT